jgi:hypothetical protein
MSISKKRNRTIKNISFLRSFEEIVLFLNKKKKESKWNELEARLSHRIQFGAAGIRAKMASRFALMNKLTVIQATQGIVHHIYNQKIKSNQIESTLKMTLTRPIRPVTADASLKIPLDNNLHSNERNTNFSQSSISMREMKKSSSNLVKKSIKINYESPKILRERLTSSSSKSSIHDSLKSFSADPSIHQDDDHHQRSNDQTNHQWNLNQIISNITITQITKSFYRKQIIIFSERTAKVNSFYIRIQSIK